MKLDGVIPSVLLVMSIGLTGIVACTSRTREQPQTDEEAVRLVKRFVAAETIGDEATTLSLLAVHRCEVIPTSDAIRPTVAAEFGAATVSADSTRVPVRYFVLGIGHVDELVDSSVRVKFARALEIETVTFAVFRGPDGRLRIDCGPHAADHLGVGGMSELEAFMPDSALKEWRAALADAKARAWY